MPDLHIRRARPFDAGAMAALLTEIIEIGGTTAMTDPPTGADILDWLDDDRATFHVAEAGGEIVGFQWIEPKADLPATTQDIATFAKPGRQGLGIGSALFETTKRAARAMGLTAIQARIADYNDAGQAYYRSRGFEDAGRAPGKVIKIYHLSADRRR